MSNKSHSPVGTLAATLLSVVILALAGWLILNRQYAFDQLSVWLYQPTQPIAAIAERSGMSDQGKFYFYAAQPAIDASAKFNTNCERREAKSAILGCYAGGKIYLYDITNEQLDGVEEVTAAHETLHVIWERMSQNDKNVIGQLLEAQYATIDDQSLKERMAYYDRYEPNEHLNELHSILGTEYTHLSDGLETHYKQYFGDRNKIVALHDGYKSVFNNLKAQSDALLVEIKALEAELGTNIAQYNKEAAAIKQEDQALKARESSVNRTSQSEVDDYNNTLQALQIRNGQLEALRGVIEAKFQIYNTKVIQYNKYIVSSNELTKSLDSTLAPSPSL